MKKIILSIILSFALCCEANAQETDYTPDGRSVHADSERVVLVVFRPDPASMRAASSNIALPGVIGSVVSIGFNLIKTALNTQEEKYTASYSAKLSDKSLLRLQNPNNATTVHLNIDSIGIYRLINLPSGEKDTALRLILKPEIENFAGLFRLKVESVRIGYAKAKIKRFGKKGKSLDLSLSIKLDALWQESSAVANPPNKAKDADSSLLSRSNYTIKTSTLGDANIIIPSIRPGSYIDTRKADFATTWFQLPPLAAMVGANEDNHYTAGYFNLAVTVKEANPYGINSKKLADFFSNNNSDLLMVVKSLLPQNGK